MNLAGEKDKKDDFLFVLKMREMLTLMVHVVLFAL